MRFPIFSFFSGSGFLDLGFEYGGFDIVYVNEIHKPFLNSYKHSRASLNLDPPLYGYHEGDITELLIPDNEASLNDAVQELKNQGDLVGFIGGPPCPDFSVGGKNRGREGDNGKLSWTYVELICKEKPSFFLFENVKGLWRTKKHRLFYDEMKKKLHENGYVTTEKLINSLEYGVPQQRERIILIGFHKDTLDKLNHRYSSQDMNLLDFPWNRYTKYTMDEIKEIMFPDQDAFSEDDLKERPSEVPEELTVEYWFNKNDVLNHPNANQYFTPRAGLAKFLVIPEGDDSKKSYKRLHRWRYSPTAAYGNNEVHLHPYKARRISVSEALAIQSLPQNFEIPNAEDITLTDAFKTVGNGVPYLAALGIAKTIHEYLTID